jgi:adenylate cyclase
MPDFLKRWGDRFGLARAIAVPVLLLLVALRIWDPLLVEAIRLRSFDMLQTLSPRVVTQYPVAIVDIDEKSLAEIGQWPWPRTELAKLVDILMQSGAAAVAFDMVFAEPDRTSPAAIARRTEGLSPEAQALMESLPDNDAVFAASLARCRCVLGYTLAETIDTNSVVDPNPPAAIAEMGGNPRAFLFKAPGIIANLPELTAAAPGRGLFSVKPESDNIVRRVPLLMRVGDAILPGLAPELLRVATGQTTYSTRVDAAGISDLVIANVKIPTDQNALVWVHFSKHDPRRFVSAADVLAGRLPVEAIAGKLVFIGTSAAGLRDLRATPVDTVVPGVEVHAQLVETILTGDYLQRPNNIFGAELAITAFFGLLLIGFVPAVRASFSLGVLVLAIAAAIFASWYAFSEHGLLVDATFPAATAGTLYGLLVYLSHYRTERQRKQTARAFSYYLSPVMAERVSRNPDALKLGGDERELTVLFTDIRGFTAISERYAGDPQGLTRIINQLMSAISKEILDREGEIDKYMGDAAMAFWNAPLDVPRHAELACRAALAIQQTVAAMNESWKTDPQFRESGKSPPTVAVGVGLNTGLCLVGNLGSDARFSYSVLGDPVNLASRVEGQTKNYGVPILITESTQAAAPQMAAIEVDLVAVKGKATAARLFALLGDETLAATPEFQAHRAEQDSLLAAYRAQDWPKAAAAAAALAARHPEIAGLYRLFADRIAALQADPPGPGWDGVFVATDK